jgi:hypothetical protein
MDENYGAKAKNAAITGSVVIIKLIIITECCSFFSRRNTVL